MFQNLKNSEKQILKQVQDDEKTIIITFKTASFYIEKSNLYLTFSAVNGKAPSGESAVPVIFLPSIFAFNPIAS